MVESDEIEELKGRLKECRTRKREADLRSLAYAALAVATAMLTTIASYEAGFWALAWEWISGLLAKIHWGWATLVFLLLTMMLSFRAYAASREFDRALEEIEAAESALIDARIEVDREKAEIEKAKASRTKRAGKSPAKAAGSKRSKS